EGAFHLLRFRLVGNGSQLFAYEAVARILLIQNRVHAFSGRSITFQCKSVDEELDKVVHPIPRQVHIRAVQPKSRCAEELRGRSLSRDLKESLNNSLAFESDVL